ncbi:MAG: type II toxin-antitoxin system RelE/ParE family toxin [Planctomycetaceae bacterium]|nr:type II toxin-antitoxin system RelE/ParE family toxin [Planctomycetaceae bacterium]
MKLHIWRAAEEELAEAALWYEKQREGLGSEFLEEGERCMQGLLMDPARFPLLETVPVDRSIRRSRLNRFPYVIVFETLSDTVVVLAVAHLHRDFSRLVCRSSDG